MVSQTFTDKMIVNLVVEIIGGHARNRTGVHGFAIRCVTHNSAPENHSCSRYVYCLI